MFSAYLVRKKIFVKFSMPLEKIVVDVKIISATISYVLRFGGKLSTMDKYLKVNRRENGIPVEKIVTTENIKYKGVLFCKRNIFMTEVSAMS